MKENTNPLPSLAGFTHAVSCIFRSRGFMKKSNKIPDNFTGAGTRIFRSMDHQSSGGLTLALSRPGWHNYLNKLGHNPITGNLTSNTMRHLLVPFCLLALLSSCKKDKDENSDPIENNKAVAWTNTYGGTNYDFAKTVVQLSTGEYVMAGTSRSSDGDIPGSRFGYDPWIAKVDTAGNKIWSNAFGTNADEHTGNMIATPDGGFVMVGHTGFNFDTTSNQGWVIKVNSTGSQVWRKDYTVSPDSRIHDIVLAADGGLVIAGYTTNGTGRDARDGWISKLDESGNPQWSITYGGSKEDQVASIITSSDGGYVACGYSASSDMDISANKGSVDGWIFKINASGIVQWSKTYGGTGKDYLRSLVRSNDGGYLAVGNATSGNGDISLNRGNFDEFVVKVDAGGNKQWVKTFGGSNDELVTAVVATSDGGYLSIGYTNSTDHDVNRTSGDFGGWLIKMDGSGNKTASSTYGGNYDDLVDDVIKTQDGGYIIAGQTYSPADTYDALLIKIKPL